MCIRDRATTVFSVSATRFMAGKFPFMMFGLPGAALAMYQCCLLYTSYTILDVMSQTGSAVFNNLALLFAMGVAIGMARKEKEVAALIIA